MAEVLVIVVTFNAEEWVPKCLGSIRTSSVPADVMVVDNGSTDGTCDFIETSYPEVKLVVNEDNIGFGAANNIGLQAALDGGYNFVYLLNQDARLEKNTIAGLLEAFTPEYGILSPVQVDDRGRLDKRFAKKCGKFLKAAWQNVAEVSGEDALRAKSSLQADGEVARVEVPFVMAAHWMITRTALQKVGGFSPAFLQYGEDDNYIDRLHYFGLKCGVVPSVKGVHDRAKRKMTRPQKMALKCISTVVKISNPSHSFFWRRILEPLELVGMGIKNISLIPFRYIPELTSRYPELRRLRADSKKEGAFLNI
jgi:N-acetylglucosaminyl-diphospho-decaprenol L-rhamnosyltransferase